MSIRLFFTANAGLLISNGTATFLVDSLFQSGQEMGFSAPPAKLLADMLSAAPPFGRIDACIFTHLHPDHGELDVIARLRDKTIPLLLPDTKRQASRRPQRAPAQYPDGSAAPHRVEIKDLQNPKILFGDNVREHEIKGVRVTAVPTAHDGGDWFAIEHCSLFFDFPEGSVFLAGDMRTEGENFSRVLGVRAAGLRGLSAACVNYPELARESGLRLIRALSPARLFLYHLPFPEEDRSRANEMTRGRIESLRGSLPPASIPASMVREEI